MNKWGRVVVYNFFSVFEIVCVIFVGMWKIVESLGKVVDVFVEGGRRKLFIFMYFMVGRKFVE